ncbi:MAG: hypothetical protein RBT74_16670 [Tenuifilaceae bacterium]|jgi:hypothetical protein|nr:hypothetical protein [Tenuifilaceae bacterium]
MSSTVETGHAKVVANFEKLIAVVSAFGASYNPTRDSIQLAALNAQLTAAKAAVAAVNAADPAYRNACNAREVAFEPLSKLITRVSSALKASGVPPQAHENALTFVRKLQGRRASRKLTEDELKAMEAQGETVTQASASQMSFDNRLDNLDKLIQLLASLSAYAPNEEELKVSSLTALYTQLQAVNTAAVTAEIPLRSTRIARNDLLYKADTGVVDTSTDVKTYVKSVFGPSSPQYKSVSGIKFTHRRM